MDLSHRNVNELKTFIRKYNKHFRIMLTGKKKADLIKEINTGMKKTVTDELKKDYNDLAQKKTKEKKAPAKPPAKTPPKKEEKQPAKSAPKTQAEREANAKRINDKLKKENDEKQKKAQKVNRILNLYTQNEINPYYNKLLKTKNIFNMDMISVERIIKKIVDEMIKDKGGDPNIRIETQMSMERGFKSRFNKEKPPPKKNDAVEGLKSMVESAKEKDKKTKVDSSIYKDIFDKMKALLKDRDKVGKINELVDDDKSFAKIKSLKNWFDEKFKEYEKLVKELEQLQNKNKNVKMSSEQENRISAIQDFFESNRFYSK